MDELDISGKRYISTRRAGKEHGYHSDYIGQLIRGKKVIGQKVGRAWYVEEDSLLKYFGKEIKEPEQSEKQVQPEQPVQQVQIEQPKKEYLAPVVEKDIEEIKQETETQHYIPIQKQVEQKVQTTGLQYVADDEPLLPQVPTTTNYRQTQRAHLIPNDVGYRPNKVKLAAGITLVVLVLIALSTIASGFIGSTTSIVEGQTANTFYSLEY